MDQDLSRSIASLMERLEALAASDEGLREDLRAVAAGLMRMASEPAPHSFAAPSIEPEARAETETPWPVTIEADATGESAPLLGPSEDEPRIELTLGRSLSRSSPPPPRDEPSRSEAMSRRDAADAELPEIEARCRLKAEGLRWAITRSRRIEEGADFQFEIAPRDHEILERGRRINCYLWMNSADFAVPGDRGGLEDLAGWFDATADAIALVRALLPDAEANREFFEPALDLLAEAQSALRVGVDRAGCPRDGDQYGAYNWLRDVTARERIYIARYMRLDDPADPASLAAVEARIAGLDARFQAARDRVKRRKAALGQVRYHARRLAGGGGAEHDWRKIASGVAELVNGGFPPSSLEIREAILPVLDGMPDLGGLPDGFLQVLREIDRYLATRGPGFEAVPADPPIPEVALAGRLLAGRSAVLIGGSRRPEALDALKAAFQLADLIWLEGREHQSIERFVPYVTRPDVALVLLAIRWSSHSFGEVKRFCDLHGKPMVRLPGGYGVNQVASQIIAQCSEQLDAG